MSNPDNVCALSGRLTAEPVFMQTKSGEEFQARFTLAIKRAYKNKDGVYDADFIPMRMNGTKRMHLAHKLKKGASIKVMGEMRTDSYVNKEGKKVFGIYLDVASLSWNPSSYRKDDASESEHKDMSKSQSESFKKDKTDFTALSSDEVDDFNLPFT